VSGAGVTDRDISRELGLPYIAADGIDMTRSRVAAHGGEVVEGSHFSSWVAWTGSQRSATRQET
jgi:predicted enzyme related to lactoylglutathione lyase